LKALGGYQKLAATKPTERRQVKILDLPRNRQVSVQDRREEARRTALRLRPNVSGLHKVVLAWDFDHAGQEPPVTGNKSQRLHVPDQFRDHAQYLQVFEPLLILECWSQITQSKTQENDSYRIKITSKQFVDDWLDADIDIVESVKKDWYLSEPDVVLLRHTERQNCLLAKVRNYSARPWGIQAGIRCYSGGNGGDPSLQINSAWRISKVFRYTPHYILATS
jgi:senataxin